MIILDVVADVQFVQQARIRLSNRCGLCTHQQKVAGLLTQEEHIGRIHRTFRTRQILHLQIHLIGRVCKKPIYGQ
ncbi:MAG: hypothetical protein EBT52_05190 [Flavobacteriia bacterium]|nr:hypothetical protein [Flavobacteriia bacterium]